ncbi:MAG: 4Fe-4S dicluster domain-containing protein [Sutterella wadsworthensis]
MCKDIPCVKACPTGALSPALTGISDARMGIAVVDPASCLSHQGLRCEVCYRACPEEEKALTIEMHPRGISRHAMFIPVVHPEHCTGCGLCTKSCPTGTPAIRIADRKAVLGEIGGHYRLGWLPDDDPKNRRGDAPADAPRLPPRAQAASTTSMRMRYEAALQHALDACPPRTSACGARALCGHGAPRVDARGRASP